MSPTMVPMLEERTGHTMYKKRFRATLTLILFFGIIVYNLGRKNLFLFMNQHFRLEMRNRGLSQELKIKSSNYDLLPTISGQLSYFIFIQRPDSWLR